MCGVFYIVDGRKTIRAEAKLHLLFIEGVAATFRKWPLSIFLPVYQPKNCRGVVGILLSSRCCVLVWSGGGEVFGQAAG